MDKFTFADITINAVTFSQCNELITEMMRDGSKGYFLTTNVDCVVKVTRDREYRTVYDNAKHVFPDGAPLVWIGKLMAGRHCERCAGADLFEEICKTAAVKGKKVFILGGVEGSDGQVIEKLKERITGLEILSYSPSFGFELDSDETGRIVDRINNFRTNVLIVCVGAPKGEKWIYRNIDRMNIEVACQLGAAMDFYLGRIRRAPKLIQQAGMEWAWRLSQEPGRLWKRYLMGNTMFILLIAREIVSRIAMKFGGDRNDSTGHREEFRDL